ncbi:transporter substrate-binding domain-containing protein [Olsenella sp. Marseille-QA0557]|uniref:transporter substrate-binding domain-containing protein n=1 Tax=Olsenella sp. Marseille-QA0557 TaxID=3378782 RepID=UPI003D139C09
MNLTRRSFGLLAVTLGMSAASLFSTGCQSPTTTNSAEHNSSLNNGGVLRAGVRADVVGFGYLNEQTDKYYGLEIDLVNEIAQKLGFGEVQFVTVTPDDRKEMLLEGNIDCICACYSIAETRLENFDFSPAYYNDSVIAVVQKSSMIDSIEEMKGLTFGTMAGSNAALLLNIKLQEIGFSSGIDTAHNEDNSDVQFDTWQLLQLPSYQELSDALEVGTIDAMVLDGAIAQTYMDDKRIILENFEVAKQSYGVATQKGSELSGQIAEAVQEMLDDGTLDALIDKWN